VLAARKLLLKYLTFHQSMLRKLTILVLSLALCSTTLACNSAEQRQSQQNPTNNTSSSPTRLSDGRYPVQQAAYNDADGEYSLMLLDTAPGTPSTFRTTNLKMARLTDKEIAAGQKNYLSINGGEAVLHLTEDFKIQYVHNVTENQTNAQTGQQETVVVRQESSFWTPFAGALAGQALGSLLFSPQYYVPPVYQPGTVLTGYGGYGSSYDRAVQQYQTRYQEPPAAVRNRQALRTTGRIRSGSSDRNTSPNANRSTGSGYGSSNLRQSDDGSRTRQEADRPSGFGSKRRARRR
jgi:hypothetical protein